LQKQDPTKSHERADSQTTKTISLPKGMAQFLETESRRLGINTVSGLIRIMVAEYMDRKNIPRDITK
jgi:hypothetical protein